MSSNWSITRLVGRCRFAVAAALDRVTYAATAAVLIGVGVGWKGLSAEPTRALVTTLAVCLTVILVRPVSVFAVAWLSHGVARVFVETVPARWCAERRYSPC